MMVSRLLSHFREKNKKLTPLSFPFVCSTGSGGGSAQTIFEIESAIGQSSAAQGWYAQAHAGTLFDGSQFKWRKDQIVKAGVFQRMLSPPLPSSYDSD